MINITQKFEIIVSHFDLLVKLFSEFKMQKYLIENSELKIIGKNFFFSVDCSKMFGNQTTNMTLQFKKKQIKILQSFSTNDKVGIDDLGNKYRITAGQHIMYVDKFVPKKHNLPLNCGGNDLCSASILIDDRNFRNTIGTKDVIITFNDEDDIVSFSNKLEIFYIIDSIKHKDCTKSLTTKHLTSINFYSVDISLKMNEATLPYLHAIYEYATGFDIHLYELLNF